MRNRVTSVSGQVGKWVRELCGVREYTEDLGVEVLQGAGKSNWKVNVAGAEHAAGLASREKGGCLVLIT